MVVQALDTGPLAGIGYMTTDDRFGRWLYAELDKRHWNQRELARRTGITPSLINRWLNGRFAPSSQNALRLADSLNLDPNLVLEAAGLPTMGAKAAGTSETLELVSIVERLRWRERLHDYQTVRGILQMFLDDQERRDKSPSSSLHPE